MTEPVFSATPDVNVAPSNEGAVAATPRKHAHVIIVGNEKGGSGKTTTTMHLIVSLLRLGFNVGSMDIDARQRSLSRYIENRRQTITKEGLPLPLPHHIVIQKSPFHLLQEAEADERERFLKGLARIYYNNDFVVIDTPGSDTYLARLAHSFADTIITPINDSFVDLDVLANVDGQTMKIVKPSIYSEMVWEQKLSRAKRDGGTIEWIVMRNRLSNIDARNKRHMTSVLNELSRRIGFRVAPGFSERVIFREMFLQGLTVLDVGDANSAISLSHVAARQEVRDLLKILKNPAIDERIAALRTGAPERVEEKSEEKSEEKTEEKTEGQVVASIEATPEATPETTKAPIAEATSAAPVAEPTSMPPSEAEAQSDPVVSAPEPVASSGPAIVSSASPSNDQNNESHGATISPAAERALMLEVAS